MKIITILTVFALTYSLTIDKNIDSGDLIVGGYQNLNLQKLPQDAKEVDSYVRNLHHFKDDVSLVKASRQVVAGFNYHLIYQSKDKTEQWDIIVYKTLNGKLYENGYTYTKTLPDGQKVKAIADPSSAFTGKRPQEEPKAIIKAVQKQPTTKLIADYTTLPNSVKPIPA